MSWWNTQPVFPNNNTPLWSTIGDIPEPSKYIDGIKIYKYVHKYWKEIGDFINTNYIKGYQYSDDYFKRKLNFKKSFGYVAMEGLTIVGFIWCSPMLVNGISVGYVDFLCVEKGYRKRGLAIKLIENIVNYAGDLVSFLHKKDTEPLPFPYFNNTSHYTFKISDFKVNSMAPYINSSINRSRITELNTEWYLSDVEKKCLVNDDWFETSDSIKTFIIDNKYLFSFSIINFKYGICRKARIAECFLLTCDEYDNRIFNTIITILSNENIDYLVVVPNNFWNNHIKDGKASVSMKLYFHAYNIVMPNIENYNIPIP